MKKLTLLLATAFVGFTASAQLYVTGGEVTGAPAAWNPANPLAVTLEDGSYTFKAKGGFKISTAKGTWDEFNAGCYTTDGAWQKSGATATVNLKKGNVDIAAPKAETEITYVVAEDLSKITGTLPNGETFGEEVAPDFYVIGGGFGSWELKNESLKMTRSGNVYTYTSESGINGAWKINDGTWAVSYGQGEAGMPVVGTLYNVAFNGGDMTSTISEKVTITFTYVEGGQSTVLLTTDGDDPNPPTPPETDYTKWYVNVIGVFNDWTDNGVHPNAEGLSTHTNLKLGTGDFRIKCWDGSSELNFSTGSTVTVGDWVELTNTTGAGMTIANGAADAVYNVEFNCATKQVKITLVGDDPQPVVVPETLYMIGNVPASEGEWSSSKGVAMTKVGDTFTCITPISDAGEGYGYFSFCQVLGDDWDTVNSMDRFGAATKDQEVVLGSTAYDFTTYKAGVNASSCQSFKIAASEPKMNYLFTMDFKTGKLTIDQKTGIDSIEAENGVAVYYNLQGQRVENPANGLFVRVLNGKATKVMVK